MHQEGLFDEFGVCLQPPRQQFDESNAVEQMLSNYWFGPQWSDEDYIKSRIGDPVEMPFWDQLFPQFDKAWSMKALLIKQENFCWMMAMQLQQTMPRKSLMN